MAAVWPACGPVRPAPVEPGCLGCTKIVQKVKFFNISLHIDTYRDFSNRTSCGMDGSAGRLYQGVARNEFGFKMLAAMGWSEGKVRGAVARR